MSRWHRTEFDFLPEAAFRARPSGGMTLEGGGGTPDTSGQNAAALMSAELSKEQLAWAKEIYAQEAPQREQTQALATRVSEAQLAQMNQQTLLADQATKDYNDTYRPLEQRLVADAQSYDTPEKRAAESAAAVATVEQNLAAQRGATMRESERAGVDPSSGKAAALQGSMDLGAAKLKAGAGNAASKAVETVGYARRMDAASLGRNIASSQGTTAALAAQNGNAAVNSSSAALAAGQSGANIMQSGFAGAQQGVAASGNMYGNIASIQGQASASKAAGNQAAAGAAVTIGAALII